MNLTDYRYPEPSEGKRQKAKGKKSEDRAMHTPGAIVAGGFAAVLIILMVTMITYQLSHPPKPMGLYPTATEGTGNREQGTGDGATMTPTQRPSPIPHPPSPDEGYDRQLPSGALGGFGKQPRDLDVGGRHFALLGCAGWDCQIELDDGAQVWVSVEQAGEPTPTPTAQPQATVRVPVSVCADATGIYGSRHLCAMDGDYSALLTQAQSEAGPPLGQPPTLDPAVLFQATQAAANGDATAYAVQTEAAQPTPVAAQQVR